MFYKTKEKLPKPNQPVIIMLTNFYCDEYWCDYQYCTAVYRDGLYYGKTGKGSDVYKFWIAHDSAGSILNFEIEDIYAWAPITDCYKIFEEDKNFVEA